MMTNDEIAESIVDDIASLPNETADPQKIVNQIIPADVLERFEVYSYRGAATLLKELHNEEFDEIMDALRNFSIDTLTIRTAGGNESAIPKIFSKTLRPLNWFETSISGDLLVKLTWKSNTKKNGKIISVTNDKEIIRSKYIDGHKIDYVKNKVAFDLEWNSKDQTFDRDLYAFQAFFESGAISVGVLVTRSGDLNRVFKTVGPALDKDGKEINNKDGKTSPTMSKYGASTTWMGKLLYRLNAGRNGGCPVLAFGIKAACVVDWKTIEGN